MIATGFEIFYFAPNRLNVREITLKNASIPDSFDDTKIIVFSDIYGDIEKTERVLNLTLIHKPDFVIFTGNILDETVDSDTLKLLQSKLKAISAPLGKYALIGINDYQKGVDTAQATLEDSDFRILSNMHAKVYRYEDEFINFFFLDAQNVNSTSLDTMFEFANTDTYSMGFTNNPKIIDTLKVEQIDVLLGGYTMLGKGRLPYIGSLAFRDNYTEPFQTINDIEMYLSGGVSTQARRWRLNASPDILLITLKTSN